MNVEIAQRLAELRRERGFSQEGLAEQLGLSRQAVSKWERAESAPDMGNLIALDDLYEVTLDELLRVSPEVEEDMRFESQERAESVETEAAAAAEAALAAAARAEAAAATAAEAPDVPKVVVEVSAPAATSGGFPPPAPSPGQAGASGRGAPHGFSPSTYGAPGHRPPSARPAPWPSPHHPARSLPAPAWRRRHRRRARVPTLLAPAHRVPFRRHPRCPLRRHRRPNRKIRCSRFPTRFCARSSSYLLASASAGGIPAG